MQTQLIGQLFDEKLANKLSADLKQMGIILVLILQLRSLVLLKQSLYKQKQPFWQMAVRQQVLALIQQHIQLI